jgi:hypothetical protein
VSRILWEWVSDRRLEVLCCKEEVGSAPGERRALV